MNLIIKDRVSKLLANNMSVTLKGRKVGLEKECLRVATDGNISQTAHPIKLGSALTHPSITTDYSEALMELVTPPFDHFSDTLQFLDDTHRFVYSQLQDEILWVTSMPCVIDGDASIRIAQYGSSNAGTMKTVYRRGLGHRYGRVMQAIAGVHYNYSYPIEFWKLYQSILGDRSELGDFISESYMGMVRNLQRFGWIVPYLFGASPAICQSFLGGKPSSLLRMHVHSLYGPYATSLRTGDIGYQNAKEDEAGIKINYDNLQGYIASLGSAISTPCTDYQKIPTQVDGQWQQLNHNILQIENEHYSSVRPKQILQGEEKPTIALAKRGVAYIELRSLDVNPYEPLGINDEQMRFLESFLLFTLLTPSDTFADKEHAQTKYNMNAVALHGRDPKLKLKRPQGDILLRQWADEILDQMSLGCELLDSDNPEHIYCSALQQQKAKLVDSSLTPSARILAEMQDKQEEFFEFSLRKSEQHQQWFKTRPLSGDKLAQFKQQAKESLQKQRQIEASDDVPFSLFLDNYFNQK